MQAFPKEEFMKQKKILASAVAALLFVSGLSATPDATLSEEKKAEMSEGLKDFSSALLVSVPNASTQQNVWADAYIGNLYPSIFPHFGFGFTLGGTYLDTSGFKRAVEVVAGDENFLTQALDGNECVTEIIEHMGLDIGTIPEAFFLPTATVDVRLGGVVLPFDIGLCAMMTNPSLFEVKLSDPSSITNMSQAVKFDLFGFNGSIDYLTIGADLRYRFFEGSKFVPVISVGGGYYYTKGNFKIGTTDQRNVSYGGQEGVQTTTMNMANGFETHVAFFQLQVSKQLGFANFFLGGRGTISNTTSTWAWDYKTSNDNENIDAYTNSEDSDKGTVSLNNQTESFHEGVWDLTKIQPQIFAGVGFNAWKFQFTLGACVDLRSFFDHVSYTDYIWSGYFSTHFKL